MEHLCRYYCSQWYCVSVVPMKEFDYSLDYKNLNSNPMTHDIVSGEENRVYCLFVPTPMISVNTGDLRLYQRHGYHLNVSMTYTQSIVQWETSWVWICVASFLRWVSQEVRRYANHADGRKYDQKET